MKLVINASPLIFLNKVDALSLLSGCFVEILVPPAVIAEIHTLRLPSFIQPATLTPEGVAYVKGAVGRLHAGELEVMVLAREYRISYVALDDLLARNKAKQLGLIPVGTAGLLLLANAKGLMDKATVRIKLQKLIDHHGLYLSSHVLKDLWAQLG